jgi:hypothetical protein
MYRSTATLLFLLAVGSPPPARLQGAGQAEWVSRAAEGTLTYRADEKGNRIPDFSRVGYKDSDAPIPELPVTRVVEPPQEKNAFADVLVQKALDETRSGAVLLRRGTYRFQGSIFLRNPGVVLRGEGEGPDGTVLIATQKKQHTLLTLGGEGQVQVERDSRQEITDSYVPCGADTLTVADASDFKVGDEVIVRRASTAGWIAAIGMDKIPPRSDGTKIQQWAPGSKDLSFERTIIGITDKALTLDAPVTNSLEKEFGPHTVSKLRFPGRIEDIGVESLRCVSEFASPYDEDHGWSAIAFRAARNGWVRKVTAEHFGFACVAIGRSARNITVEDCTCLDPISKIEGGRRYPFQITGQRNLVQRCKARNGRHDFALDSSVPGPNVFLDCTATESHADSGPHHRWSCGVLYDNLTITAAKGAKGVGINIRNRGNLGTGHGWTGAYQAIWNSTAPEMRVENPPTAQNWVVQSKTIPSLFQAQLAQRRRK